jgi:hypothetical protein
MNSVVNQKFLSLICHSGLDPESRVSQLDSRFRGNDGFGIISKEFVRFTTLAVRHQVLDFE